LALAVVAYWLARIQVRELKLFFALLAIAAVFNLSNLLTWNQLPWIQGLYVPATTWSSMKGSNQVSLSHIRAGSEETGILRTLTELTLAAAGKGIRQLRSCETVVSIQSVLNKD